MTTGETLPSAGWKGKVESTLRLESLKPGGMCQYKVYLTQLADVDDELMGWITRAKLEKTRVMRLAQMLIELHNGNKYMNILPSQAR